VTLWPELRVNVARLQRHDNLRELKRQASDSDTVEVATTVLAQGIETTTARVVDGTPVTIDARLRPGPRDVELHAMVTSQWEAECRRCLKPVTGPIEVEVRAMFVESIEDLDDAEADVYEIEGEIVDVGEVVREELMLALPLTPICESGCVGADPDRFPTGADDDSEDEAADGSSRDPRWDVLSSLRFDEE
jgi:uncharacterized protein